MVVDEDGPKPKVATPKKKTPRKKKEDAEDSEKSEEEDDFGEGERGLVLEDVEWEGRTVFGGVRGIGGIECFEGH
jgi:hypothetical protein